MEATNNKEQVMRLFLSFLLRWVPFGISQAQLATLGGRGWEAKIWSELGVPKDHGWLIERSRKRAARLIAENRYLTQNQLGTFHTILAGLGEDRARIDAFHLDLCGQFCNTAITNFTPVLPLLLKSRGRCLAITVADQRGNLAVKYWPRFKARGKELFGAQAPEIYQQILAQQHCVPVKQRATDFIQPFSCVKGAKREFGLLVELAELLRTQQLPWIPAAIERYIYVSRYNRSHFRMRTYFFRFGEQFSDSPELVLADAWVNSPMFFANDEAFAEVVKPAAGIAVNVAVKTAVQIIRREPMNKQQHLVLSGYVAVPQTDYDQLVADSQHLANILSAVNQSGNTPEAPLTPPPAMQDPAHTPGKGNRRTRKAWSSFTPCEQIAWIFKALELRKSIGGKFTGPKGKAAWVKLLKEDFGYYKNHLGSSMRSCLARTNGEKFRPEFEARIREACGTSAQSYLDRLVRL